MSVGPATSERIARRAELRRRKARRRARIRAGLALLAAGAAAAVAALALLPHGGGHPPGAAGATPASRGQLSAVYAGQIANGPETDLSSYAGRPAPPSERVAVHFRHPPRGGLLFDVDTGEVLWQRNLAVPRTIASLTKMMTALLAVEKLPARAHVPVTRAALHYQGSGVGLLPKGKAIKLETMLYGLLLPSGNDAAIAIAQRVGRSVPRFVGLMNRRAAQLGLRCTHFTSPSGFVDRHNHSCPHDLAVLGRAVLDEPRLARIVATRRAVLRFPIKGHRLFLFNNNTLMRIGYPGVVGIKTGFTDKAGHCLVAAAHRHGVRLGIVLLHSPDTASQGKRLLDAGFRAVARR